MKRGPLRAAVRPRFRAGSGRRVQFPQKRRAAVRPSRGLASRPRALPGAARPARTRRVAAAAIAVALLAIAFWLWAPASESQPPAAPPIAGEHDTSTETPPKSHVAHAPRLRKRASPKPATAPAAIDEARLRTAVASHAADLRACALPPGAPPLVPARLRLAAAGVPKSVELSPSDPIPASLATCLRERILAWRFADLGLASDVDVLVTFALR